MFLISIHDEIVLKCLDIRTDNVKSACIKCSNVRGNILSTFYDVSVIQSVSVPVVVC